MDEKDLRIDIIGRHSKGMMTAQPSIAIVKVTHIPSSISVTKYSRSQLSAKNECCAELAHLVNKWIDHT